MTNSSSIIKETLKGKTILITGCTGFLGKVLLEKIIRSTSDVAKIYLLIRNSERFKSGQQRLEQEILSSSIFMHVKSLKEDAFNEFCQSRIEVVSGELTEKRFGLSEEDFAELASQIDVIINSAASVDFREPLDQALHINTLSLKNIIELSRTGGDIPVVQVSTCYVHGLNKGDIYEETLGPCHGKITRNAKGQYLVEGLISRLQDKITQTVVSAGNKNSRTKALVDLGIEEANRFGWNDTYTFTKWLGEQLLIEKLDGKSLSIVRPAIIESTLQAPVPGWIEGIKVADAIVFAYARGKVSYFPANPHGIIDIIPADLVANAVIMATVKALRSPGETHIYQCCSSGSNPVTIAELKRAMVSEAQANYRSYPKLFKMKKPAEEFTFVSRAVFEASMKAAQVPLELLQDVKAIFGVKQDKNSLHKNISTAINLSTTFSFYCFPKYRFHNGKLLELAQELGEKADGEFAVDARLINWPNYFGKIHLNGLERYAINEDAKSALVKKNSAGNKMIETSASKSGQTRNETLAREETLEV
jgi:nucleoside-diphosphate-sugar epimerase